MCVREGPGEGGACMGGVLRCGREGANRCFCGDGLGIIEYGAGPICDSGGCEFSAESGV